MREASSDPASNTEPSGGNHEAEFMCLLFCLDLVHEADGFVTPFRMIEAATVSVHKPPADSGAHIAIWDPIGIRVFIAASCYVVDTPHKHSFSVEMFYPDGKLLGKFSGFFGMSDESRTSYRDGNIRFAATTAGRYSFQLSIDGMHRKTAIFTVKHEEVEPANPNQTAQKTPARTES